MKLIYKFEEGSATQRDLLGGKGAGLAEMTNIGLPVPPGFTITTETCRRYYELGGRLPDGLWESVVEYVHWLEGATDKQFGSPERPLLVSVRSGARFSMPGMMDTILNLGINSEVREGIAHLTNDRRFALDTHRRFLQLFASVVLGVPRPEMEAVLEQEKHKADVHQDYELTPENLEAVIAGIQEVIRGHYADGIPDDPWQQLRMAIEAVFKSWNNERAIAYREYQRIPHDLGTAVTVQTMVMGNTGMDSGSGVLFTRNPSTGEKTIFGEFAANAQGEDVVAGTHNPEPISSLAGRLPEVYQQLESTVQRLERHYRDVQDVEFTVERGRLYFLQTRAAQRTALAAVRTAVALATEGIINREEAVKRVTPAQIVNLMVPQFLRESKAEASRSGRLLATGLAASPGAAVGKAVFEAKRAAALGESGESVILVRPETNPDDVPGVLKAKGVLTARGGNSSHAAVVARGLGKPAVVACSDIDVDVDNALLRVNGTVLREGEEISIDGATGEVFAGRVETQEPKIEDQLEMQSLLSWADEFRRLGVRANADTPEDARAAALLGAEGIGLCRTEHMLLYGPRLALVRKALLASSGDEAGRQAYTEALDELERYHEGDFGEIFEIMAGKPVIVRLLDAPLHEFLPRHEDLLREVVQMEATSQTGPDLDEKRSLLRVVEDLREANPMLGHRGCRLGMTHPEFYDMQVRAITTAAANLVKNGMAVIPEIMIPLVATAEELHLLRERLLRVVEEVQQKEGVNFPVPFGSMIETPRAALTSGQIARYADFFSFGSNDLTQMSWGFSRDDAEGKFLRYYVDTGVLPANPFVTLDKDGVGRLISLSTAEGRLVRPDLEVGVCGEHGGDPESIIFCHQAGLNYVSASPYRVPVARIVAAQAALGAGEGTA